jgi:hypothetical protein
MGQNTDDCGTQEEATMSQGDMLTEISHVEAEYFPETDLCSGMDDKDSSLLPHMAAVVS